nr:MAG TPA: hypothetical protein [Caudoviricetes sp.]
MGSQNIHFVYINPYISSTDITSPTKIHPLMKIGFGHNKKP